MAKSTKKSKASKKAETKKAETKTKQVEPAAETPEAEEQQPKKKRQSRQVAPDYRALSERCELIQKALAELSEVAARHPASVGKHMQAFSRVGVEEGGSTYWYMTGLDMAREEASPRDWVRDMANGWNAMVAQIKGMGAFYKAMVVVEEQAQAKAAEAEQNGKAKAAEQLGKAQKALAKLEKKLAASPDDEELQGKVKAKKARIRKLAKKAGVTL